MRDGELPRLALRTVLGVLVLGAGLVLTTGRTSPPAATRSFQRLVGGLGLGAAVDLRADPAVFDVRLGTPPAPLAHPERAAAAWIADPSSERAAAR